MRIVSELGTVITDPYQELAKEFGESKAKILLSKTGPTRLFKCAAGVDALDLAVSAYTKLKSTIDADDLSALIYVTESSRLRFPGNGFLFANKVQLPENLPIYDLNAGCTGFVDALRLANGIDGKSLIVCADNYTKQITKYNRATSPIFSDGAAVIYFDPENWKFVETITINDTKNYSTISCRFDSDLEMAGSVVFEFVNRVVAPSVLYLASQNITNYIFLHQGSAMVIDHLKSKLKGVRSVIPTNIYSTGNLVSATIPRLIEDTCGGDFEIQSGSRVILVGFGVGLSMSAILMEKQ